MKVYELIAHLKQMDSQAQVVLHAPYKYDKTGALDIRSVIKVKIDYDCESGELSAYESKKPDGVLIK